MSRFLVVRLLTLLAGLLLASLIIFLSLRLLPGDVAQVIGGTSASAAQVDAIRERLGLDRPLPLQYFDWLGGIFTGQLGNSIVSGTSIAAEIAQKAQVTVPLTLYSLVVALVVALPLGVFTAYRRNALPSRIISVLGVVAAAVPAVWAGLLGIMLLSTWLGLLPAQGFPRDGWADPMAALRSLTLPALTIGLIEGAILFRFVKSATLNAIGAEHVRTAMSRGYTRFGALIRHGLPGVGLSVISILGLQVAGLLVGAVVIEQLFSLPGLGRMLVVDVGQRDLIKVQSTLFVLTAVILALGALIDVMHRVVDPRLRVEEQ
ncbi:ABC transporter permease [Leucobacter sp. UT-8R-CII-1-4]|uniref:ABC transporter permease n=1 Tax=Leucobacter sp. UT-8R-CII-1-4 TaxID=3040075 RepID=UPI0024A7AC30|nr:ABC transporter permease [Leucobacter sp. UT-8R-CII-1-4]MDI6022071.1 ABC transporter permease [Leucobacter sp. UT-8R-CII-1-4]